MAIKTNPRTIIIQTEEARTKVRTDGEHYLILAHRVHAGTYEKKETKINKGESHSYAPGDTYIVCAPLAGRIASCTSTVGKATAAYQCVVVIEAMKMENEITIPMPGTITEILVSPGQMVDAGQVLMKITID